MDPREHILNRPSMYIGSTVPKIENEYIAITRDNAFHIHRSQITFSPALLRIFIEILSNAIDNVQRSKTSTTPSKKIKIYLNKTTGETTIWNDGEVIPVEINTESLNNDFARKKSIELF